MFFYNIKKRSSFHFEDSRSSYNQQDFPINKNDANALGGYSFRFSKGNVSYFRLIIILFYFLYIFFEISFTFLLIENF